MKKLLLILLIVATNQLRCQKTNEIIGDFEAALEFDVNEWCEPSLDIRNLSTYKATYSEILIEEYYYLKEAHGIDNDLMQIENKKERKMVISMLTNRKDPEFYALHLVNGFECAKNKYLEILEVNESFKNLYHELGLELTYLDIKIPAKVQQLNELIKIYIKLFENQLTIWEEELERIKNEKTIREEVFLSVFNEKSIPELKKIQDQYTELHEELEQYIYHNDLYGMVSSYDDVIQKKSVLNAEIIRADAVNGDGIYVAKIIDKKWGMFQVWDKNPTTLVEPDYDSIGQLGWNDPFIKVWSSGKVGLHGMNFSDETDSLLVPCVYDELIIGNVTGYQHEYLGKYCAVRKGNKWGFVNWTNGEVIEPLEMANYKEIDSFGRVARKQEW